MFKKKAYKNIFIIEDRDAWQVCEHRCNKAEDLVLTYDFALKKSLESASFEIKFFDSLVEREEMQKNNFLIYDFFKKWHFDSKNNDIFVYKEIPFGFSFRLDFWNDYVEYMRLYINSKVLTQLNYDVLYVNVKDKNIITILEKLSINFVILKSNKSQYPSYYFPISQWMDEKLRPSGAKKLKLYLKEKLTYIYISLLTHYDKVFHPNRKHLYIHEYHPTVSLVERLKKENKFNIILHQIRKRKSINSFKNERYIPIYTSKTNDTQTTRLLMDKIHKEKTAMLILADGSDITEIAYDIILTRVALSLNHKLKILDSIISYTHKVHIELLVLIANIGEITTLLHCVCQTKNIPSFLIINGLLDSEYLDESKYATVINAYSQNIKTHYFRGMDNIVTLGDPRMDNYPLSEQKTINREMPTVLIGASGFNSTDLNAYLAVEFDFMYDVLLAMKILKERGVKMHLIIKVRANGYKQQYEDFVAEYFSDTVDEIIDTTAMKEVLLRADFYISIYSQTLFEASCLGIPVVYYKKDKEIMNAPFDGKSELVTLSSIEHLVEAFTDFQNNHKRYHDFLDREVMEKYVGYLDGKNLERNKNFIYELLK